MRLKLVVLMITVSLLFTGCGNASLNVAKKSETAKNYYEEYKTLFRESAMEALDILEHYDLEWTRIYTSDNEAVYVDALDAEIQSEKLYEALTHIVKMISAGEDGIDFSLDTSGFVSSSDYSGIFYSPTDDINSLPLYLPDLEYVREDNIVTGSKKGSDNAVYIERIEEGFFYYYMTF